MKGPDGRSEMSRGTKKTAGFGTMSRKSKTRNEASYYLEMDNEQLEVEIEGFNNLMKSHQKTINKINATSKNLTPKQKEMKLQPYELMYSNCR